MRVLVDCDGVLGDVEAHVLELIERKLGKKFHKRDISEWDIFGSLGITDETVWEDAVKNDKFCLTMPPFTGSLSAMREIADLAEVYVVTSPFRCSPWMHERTEWLNTTFGIDSKHVVHTSAKHIVEGDVLIDDNADNITSWLAHHPTKNGVFMQQEFKKLQVFGEPNVLVTSDWSEIVSLIRRLSHG